MSDRELLEWAAKAAELKEWGWMADTLTHVVNNQFVFWEPLTDDGDALRLAVKLWLEVRHANGAAHAGMQGQFWCTEDWFPDGDANAATRRAIVRAAASIGQQKGE